jgi:hypothetical protein
MLKYGEIKKQLAAIKDQDLARRLVSFIKDEIDYICNIPEIKRYVNVPYFNIGRDSAGLVGDAHMRIFALVMDIYVLASIFANESKNAIVYTGALHTPIMERFLIENGFSLDTRFIADDECLPLAYLSWLFDTKN